MILLALPSPDEAPGAARDAMIRILLPRSQQVLIPVKVTVQAKGVLSFKRRVALRLQSLPCRVHWCGTDYTAAVLHLRSKSKDFGDATGFRYAVFCEMWP